MRRLVVFAILLAGCSDAKPSRPSVARKDNEPKWRMPAPDPETKPPPPPVKPPPPPPPDPAAEARKAESARKRDVVRQQQAREKEYAQLPSAVKRRLALTADSLTNNGLNGLNNADLIEISLYPRQFPAVSAADLAQALAVFGDEKGALEHLASLRISDPDTALRVRAAFGTLPAATCDAARAVAEEIGRIGLAGASDRAKLFAERNPKLFPLHSTETSTKAP